MAHALFYRIIWPTVISSERESFENEEEDEKNETKRKKKTKKNNGIKFGYEHS